MTPEILARIGAALYGTTNPEDWHAKLREELSVSDRTFRRWLAGSDPLPHGVLNDLHAMMRDRVRDLQHLLTLV